MKNLNTIKKIVTVLFLTSLLSCNNDDSDINITNAFVGEWQRSDFSTDFEYKLIFSADFTGYRTQREGNEDTGIISNATLFKWSTNDDQLTIDFYNEIIKTTFLINSDGLLILNNYPDVSFKKLN